MTSGFLKLFQSFTPIASGLYAAKKYLPIGFAIIILLLSLVFLISDSVEKKDPTIFIKGAVLTIAGYDYNIWIIITEMKTDPDSYTFFKFLILISDLIVMYQIIKFFSYVVDGTFSAGSFMISLLIVGLIQLAVGKLADGTFYIPYSGLIALIINLPAVLNNIYGMANLGKKVDNFINQTTDNEVMDLVINAKFKKP